MPLYEQLVYCLWSISFVLDVCEVLMCCGSFQGNFDIRVLCFRILIFELQLLFDGEHVFHQTADWCYL